MTVDGVSGATDFAASGDQGLNPAAAGDFEEMVEPSAAPMDSAALPRHAANDAATAPAESAPRRSSAARFCTPEDPTGDSYEKYRAALERRYQDHVTGRLPLLAEDSLRLRTEISRVDQILYPGRHYLSNGYSAKEHAYMAAGTRALNNLGIAALGPLAGAGAVAGRHFGASEASVELLGRIGLDLVSGVSLPRALPVPTRLRAPGARGPEPPMGRDVLPPARSRAPASERMARLDILQTHHARYMDVETIGPEAARQHVRDLRAHGTAGAQRDTLTALIAGRDSPARTAALEEFGRPYSHLNLDEFRRPNGTPFAATKDERIALAHILVQRPHMTPSELSHAQDLAGLSQAVYPKVKTDPSQGLRATVPPGYERVTDLSGDPRLKGLARKDFENPKSGFYADLFRNTQDGSYVVSFRGTLTGKNWRSSLWQGAGWEDRQYGQAMRLARDLKTVLGDSLARFTGHSQGGGQAAAAAMLTNKPAITYNAAGLNRKTVEREGGVWNADNIINYHVRGETLTHMQDRQFPTSQIMPSAVGRQIEIIPLDAQGRLIGDGILSGIELHKMHSVLRALRVDPAIAP